MYDLDGNYLVSMPNTIVYGANNSANFAGAIVNVSSDGKYISAFPFLEMNYIPTFAVNFERLYVVVFVEYLLVTES